MKLSLVSQAAQEDAFLLVFANVLLQQLGLPVPAVPSMLLAGSAVENLSDLGPFLLAAVSASVIADVVWYFAGKAFGYRVLSVLCRLSINPASCVSQTEAKFNRWGAASLIVAKFVPGFSTVAPPIAGAIKMSLTAFTVAAAIGAALWAGLALIVGWVMRSEVQLVIGYLEANAAESISSLVLLVCLWVAWKFMQKYRFKKTAAIEHVTPSAFFQLMAMDRKPLVLDLRGARMLRESRHIEGAVSTDLDTLFDSVATWPKQMPIVTLCACPEDASAVLAAKRLMEAGFEFVRPLKGGYEAWHKAVEEGKA